MKALYKSAIVKSICFALLMILTANTGFAGIFTHHRIHKEQKKKVKSHLELKGLIQDNMGSMGRVTISICIDSTVFFTTQSNRSGRCKVILPLNGRFIIVFSSPNYVSKKICINTKVPQSRSGVYKFNFTIDLFEQINGLDVSALDNPVAIVAYNNFMNAFDYDYNYTVAINASIKKLYNEYYSLKDMEKSDHPKK